MNADEWDFLLSALVASGFAIYSYYNQWLWAPWIWLAGMFS